MAFCLKRTLTKLTAFVHRCLVRRRRSQRLRSFVSDDRKVEIRIVLDDQRRIVEKLERAANSSYGRCEQDVDKRAEIFIDTVHRQLRLERQTSLQLRYYRVNSSETEYVERSPPKPPPLPPIFRRFNE